jgi:hypothetical protein
MKIKVENNVREKYYNNQYTKYYLEIERKMMCCGTLFFYNIIHLRSLPLAMAKLFSRFEQMCKCTSHLAIVVLTKLFISNTVHYFHNVKIKFDAYWVPPNFSFLPSIPFFHFDYNFFL